MTAAPWSLHLLSEVLASFSVDSPAPLGDVIHRVAESVDAEIMAIVRDGALTISSGLLPEEHPQLLDASDPRTDELHLGACRYHLFWVPLGPEGLLAVGRANEPFSLEERALLRGMGRCVHLSLQVLTAVQAEKEALRAEQLAKEEAIREATLDHLTGLPNRRRLLRHLQVQLQSRPAADIAVLFIDLDGFKQINDLYGHGTGDEVLKVLAARLRRMVRGDDLIGRISGDEFLLISLVQSLEDASRLAARILASMNQSMRVNNATFQLSASIGMAIAEAGNVSETLLENADMAMYTAKQLGKNQVVGYSPSMRERLEIRHRLQQELREGLANGEIRAWLQPIVSAAHGAVIGFEALVRWQHPRCGLLTPERFIPVAQEAGLLFDLDMAVMADACSRIGAWPSTRQGMAGRLSVNLSAVSLAQPDLFGHLERSLQSSGFPPGQLFLEITETTLVEDLPSAYANIKAAEQLGIQLAIDDFGTGYSSLSYLRRFPVGILKIDRCFVDGLGSEDEDALIVETVIRMASSLGLEVVAEGVENEEQVRILRSFGCHYLQGYLYGQPADARCSQELYEASLKDLLLVDLLGA
jgi:diguanylate cyclase (GGDEF)-like protein